MDCEFLERVSLLIDGEMSREESERVRAHITSCAVCSRAEQEFLIVREQIRSYKPAAGGYNRDRALREITERWWEKKIALPVPAFAFAVLLMLALVTWLLLARPSATAPGAGQEVTGTPQIKSPAKEMPVDSQPSFSRFDHGARAVIYKARRTDSGILEQ
ncbi:MAG TPA: zf-HC2 domain-containing protein [Blastocatellia bacterium]|nr:zf-HC2 domain-containing protein [Blastocatellia bacterium]